MKPLCLPLLKSISFAVSGCDVGIVDSDPPAVHSPTATPRLWFAPMITTGGAGDPNAGLRPDYLALFDPQAPWTELKSHMTNQRCRALHRECRYGASTFACLPD